MMEHRTAGKAAAISINVGGNARLFLEREVEVDAENGIVYVSDSSGQEHEITAPLSAVVIQWIPETGIRDREDF